MGEESYLKKKKNFKSLGISDLREKFGPYTHCHTEPEPPKCNTAFNFACACNFPHSSLDLLGKRRTDTDETT